MFARLLFLFIVTPVVELALLLKFADATDWKLALVLAVATGIVGAWLVKSQAGRTLGVIRADLAQGKLPADALLDGVLIAVAGALLLTPGVLTDLLAITVLVPAIRRWYRAWLVKWFRGHFTIRTSFRVTPSSEVVDSYVVPPADERRGPPPGIS